MVIVSITRSQEAATKYREEEKQSKQIFSPVRKQPWISLPLACTIIRQAIHPGTYLDILTWEEAGKFSHSVLMRKPTSC